jgi:hypothetical protein
LEAKRKGLNPVPPRPEFAELNLPIRLADNALLISTDNEQEGDSDPDEASSEQLARDFMKMSTATSHGPPSANKKIRMPKTPEVIAAENWVTSWKAAKASNQPAGWKPKTTAASLRAYAVWYEGEKTVEETAAMLRDPPLQTSTVVSYILEAVRLEKLPYREKQLKAVLDHLPPEVLATRYKSIQKSLEAEEKGT